MRRSRSTRSRFTRTGIQDRSGSDREFGFAPQARALAEDFGQDEHHQHREPGGQGEAVVDDLGFRGQPAGETRKNVTADLQARQHQPDQAQAHDIVGVEGIAGRQGGEDLAQALDNDHPAAEQQGPGRQGPGEQRAIAADRLDRIADRQHRGQQFGIEAEQQRDQREQRQQTDEDPQPDIDHVEDDLQKTRNRARPQGAHGCFPPQRR
ncbi:hypothetical protein CC_0149 [Caulobacter vibrioides CB15]|uniref:Uncharacterized protein n=1 Tax=Caulobacter vibrioides (strain ATCC 19089 / CIP 103742 / CB 15) TaxID=190650 RepID=Q9ABS1_CAUVC|nr:hypothetical protein CC_0149 [Caulobacter vibrioides CB15]